MRNGETIQCIEPKKKPIPKSQPLTNEILIGFSDKLFFTKNQYEKITTGKRKRKERENPKKIPNTAKLKPVYFFIILKRLRFFLFFLYLLQEL